MRSSIDYVILFYIFTLYDILYIIQKNEKK